MKKITLERGSKMSEEKLFDVNGVQSQWETSVGTQDMKL